MEFFRRPTYFLALLCAPLVADSLLPLLNEKQAAAVKKEFTSYKASPKGPYYRIRWFCKDGSILPPEGTPCPPRSGVQHAELLSSAEQLTKLNIHVGTILTAIKYEDLFDAANDHHWLKELVLEKFLVQTDQGWIYRKAVSYRGARQIEDEEKAGRAFLQKLLSDPAWVSSHYYLANQLVETLPHGIEDSTVRKIRSLAAVAADQDSRFQPIRAKIHSYPGPEDLDSVRKFIAEKSPAEAAKKTLEELVALMTRKAATLKVATSLENAAEVTLDIRKQVTSSTNGKKNLELLDKNAALLEEAFQLRTSADVSRLEMLSRALQYYRLATGAGLLSTRQLEALEAELGKLTAQQSVDGLAYRSAIRYLGRASEWCRATAAKEFGPVVRHYQDAEPMAKPLVDNLLRSSVTLPMTNLLEVLLADADRAAGIRHSILGKESSGGVVGLNPGVAVGKLGIMESEESVVDPRGIYIIPETVSDLKPMAGILTLDSGNMLSHAQLLAANLGIPNATIPSALKPELARREGVEMFYAVTPRNVVILKEKSALTPAEAKLWAAAPTAASRSRITLDTGRLKLGDRQLHKLTEVSAKDSGVICGPKAANLGQLASFFPDKVAKGVVVPFGIFYAHINRVLDDSGKTLQQQISEAVDESEKLRASGAEPLAISAFMYPKLAQFRKTIETMPLLPDFEKEITATMATEFGPDGSFGVFVRSDTNAEDLPEFTGAGLNLTLPNQVGTKTILKALRAVWASPFTERAYDWRARALKGTDKVYPSVIVMLAVPNEKSGVIGTADLESGDQSYITVNVSEGVSAVVDGGVAESLLLGPDGNVRLLNQCRATYRKVPSPTGGFKNLAAIGEDYLLKPDEITQLRAMVAEVKRKYPVVKSEAGLLLPWDIEFGFVKGQLRLFQIRPLVRFQEVATLQALSKLESGAKAEQVQMNGKPVR